MKLKLTFLLLICCFAISAQFQSTSYMINGYTLPYQVLYPKDYNENKKYPLVVFLHGAGERGNDNQKQLTHGKDFIVNNFEANYPSIVIIPQCPENSYWADVEKYTLNDKNTFKFGIFQEPTPAMQTLEYLIKSWIKSGLIDTKQIYIGGLSMGGMGTDELLWRMPDTFAAAFTICGGCDIQKVVDNTKNTPLWIFHGDADGVVPVQLSRDLYKSLIKAGNDAKYSEYPNVNHNSWDNAFQEKDLIPWLFSHKK